MHRPFTKHRVKISKSIKHGSDVICLMNFDSKFEDKQIAGQHKRKVALFLSLKGLVMKFLRK